MKKTESRESLCQETTAKLLKLMGFSGQVKVIDDQANQALTVQVETEEAGALIGYHGETIAALQLILGVMVNRKSEERVRVLVNIGDYREKREETLKRMALNAAQKAHFSGNPVVLADLSPQERRIVHLALQEHTDIETYSEGEGRERKLIIKPR